MLIDMIVQMMHGLKCSYSTHHIYGMVYAWNDIITFHMHGDIALNGCMYMVIIIHHSW